METINEFNEAESGLVANDAGITYYKVEDEDRQMYYSLKHG